MSRKFQLESSWLACAVLWSALAVAPAAAEELSDRKLLGVWVAIAVVIPVAIGSIPCCIGFCRSNKAILERRRRVLFFVAVGASAICWLAFLIMFFTAVFDDAVDVNNFAAVTYTTLEHDANPYRCCERRNCTCAAADSDAPSCSVRIANLTAGPCGNGPQCCASVRYSCNCYSDAETGRTRCSKCSRCVRHVGNHYCDVVCGTCHNPVASVEYTYDGRRYNQAIGTRCGLNDTACVDAHWSTYPLEQSRQGFVDPSDPGRLRPEPAVNPKMLAACIVVAGIATVAWIVAIVLSILLSEPRPDPDE